MTTIVLADDHIMLRNGLAALVKTQGYNVLYEAGNGKELIEQLDPDNLPDIVLMDLNMPEMDGYETTKYLRSRHPTIKVLALSMYDHESAIIRILKCGAKGYILKDSDPDELKQAIEAVEKKGFYYSELVSGKLITAMNKIDDESTGVSYIIGLNEKETEFIRLTCTELSYKEIAEKMQISPRTVDNYRDSLFERLHLKSRVGLVMYAIKNQLVNIR